MEEGAERASSVKDAECEVLEGVVEARAVRGQRIGDQLLGEELHLCLCEREVQPRPQLKQHRRGARLARAPQRIRLHRLLLH